MNNYNDQPPKLFGLALIEYKKKARNITLARKRHCGQKPLE
jgi:hypothetical protein